MMSPVKVATVQFENKSGDKHHNINKIHKLCAVAVEQGAKVVAFHECSMTGYTFARHLTKEEMLELAESVPNGECRNLGDEVVTATLFPEKLTQAGGYRYRNARRPSLYREIISQDHLPEQKVVWLEQDKNKR
jgi:predicted amidohydrolase